MSSENRSLSPTNYRISKQGFRPLTDGPETTNMARNNDGMMDIPLQTVVSHGSTGLRGGGVSSPINPSQQATFYEKGEQQQAGGHFHGRRKLAKLDSKGQKVTTGADGEEDSLTKLGVIYTKILNFSIVTRYLIYVLPVAALLAIPIIVGATAAPKAHIGGVRIIWFFTWIEVVWLGLWVSKIVAHFLPVVFQALVGVVSAGVRKYALVIKALEIPLSLVGWAAVALTTLKPLMEATLDESKGDKRRGFQDVLTRVLAACLASTLVLFAEKLLIQLISINYHRKQFNSKIKDSKRNIHLLSLLYDASRALFPMYCNEFAEEDYVISDSLDFALGSRTGTGQKRPHSANPMRLLQDVGRFGDKITSAFGNVAHEITGKKVFQANSAHTIVVEALEKNRSAEALARRIWLSMVLEGRNALFADDIAEVLGADRQVEAEECFAALDRDGNGDISLDEMILTVTEFGRERKSIASSMHDVDQAIHVLDGLLATVVFIITIFLFIAFLNTNFVTTLATAGTALLSLSFVFAATTQEVLGSCIFLFVKHPYDVGDRVDLSSAADKLVVEHISLLFTTFRRTDSGKCVQIPNIVLNNLWVENVTRSNAMRETVSLFVSFDTSFEDIKLLKNEMQAFVRDKENSRDFQPDIDIDVAGIAEMNKMELRCEIRHKSNWANGVVAGGRRSKFMCALVLALRKVPIYGPGGGDAALGAVGNPSYSVAINHEQAQHQKELFAKEKDESRLFPLAGANPQSGDKGVASGNDYLSPNASESQAVNTLSQRNPVTDPARDDTWHGRDDVSSTGRPSIDEDTRTLLHKAPSTGRRRAASRPPVPIIEEPQAGPASRSGLTYMPPSTQAGGEGYNNMSTQQAHMQQMRGNAFAQASTSASPAENPPGIYQGQSSQPGGRRVSGETARPGGTSPYAQPPGGPRAYRPYGGT